MRRYAPLVLIACLWAAPALAQVPEATIQRIVDLKVQAAENLYLAIYGEIGPDTSHLRRQAINAELRSLNQQLGLLSRDEQRRVQSRIDGLADARIATLKPQWIARSNQSAHPRPEHDQALPEARPMPKVPPGKGSESERDHRQGRAPAPPPPPPAVVPHAPRPTAAIRQPVLPQGGGGLGWQAWLPSQIPWGLLPTALYLGAIPAVFLLLRWARSRSMKQPEGRAKRLAYTLIRRRRLLYASALVLLSCWIVPIGHDSSALIFRFGSVLGVYGLLSLLRRISDWISDHNQPEPATPISDIYGTAHYAPLQLTLWDDGACVSEGLFLGKSSTPSWRGARIDAPGAPVCTTPEHHTLIVARTRTGKGTRVIVPTLLRYGGSALVIDPKGENAAITACIRKEQLGQSIHILNPWNELASTYQDRGFTPATYNPLDILDRNDPNAVGIAQTLAGAICPMPAHNKDTFWAGNAASVLAAVFLWLADQPGERKTLRRAREIISLPKREFEANYLIPMAASERFFGAIQELAAPFIGMADQTYSGIMANLSESTRFLSDPQIKTATETSSFSMQDLATKSTTVYVVIPTDRVDTQKTWLRLVIAAALHTFKHPDVKRPSRRHRCLFLIDEFPALGRLHDLPRDIATMSGFGVDFALIVQGLGQLKDHYGDARTEIINNCAYQWFCNVGDLESAKYLSETLGKATVGTTSTSESSSTGRGAGSQGSSTSYGETGRSLLTPDEVMNLGRDVAIVLQPGDHPHYLRPIDYWSLPNAFSPLKQTCPRLYWNPPLAYDENPYRPGSGSAARRDRPQQ